LDTPELTVALENLHLWPISPEVCLNLRLLDFTSDPADELIAATSLTYSVPLVTRDRKTRTTSLPAWATDNQLAG
jgi:PIN domain nuclease of toxin-antitoxin system